MSRPFIVPQFNPNVRVSWFGPTQKTRIHSTADTNATLLRAGPAVLEGILLFNKNAAARFLKFYDQSALPTVGTDPVDWTLTLPPTEPFLPISLGVAIPYLNGLAFAITANLADTDTNGVSADDIHGLLLWSGQP